jgi:CRISPR type III-B/RAMP module-associated protein Cmr5
MSKSGAREAAEELKKLFEKKLSENGSRQQYMSQLESLIKSLPLMIRSDGLIQTMCYLASRSGENESAASEIADTSRAGEGASLIRGENKSAASEIADIIGSWWWEYEKKMPSGSMKNDQAKFHETVIQNMIDKESLEYMKRSEIILERSRWMKQLFSVFAHSVQGSKDEQK